MSLCRREILRNISISTSNQGLRKTIRNLITHFPLLPYRGPHPIPISDKCPLRWNHTAPGYQIPSSRPDILKKVLLKECAITNCLDCFCKLTPVSMCAKGHVLLKSPLANTPRAVYDLKASPKLPPYSHPSNRET